MNQPNKSIEKSSSSAGGAYSFFFSYFLGYSFFLTYSFFLSAAGAGADDPPAGAPRDTFGSPLLINSSTFLLPMDLRIAST
jgi:hypothetical protein